MRGRINMPPDTVIALVRAVKIRHMELRDNTKLNYGAGTVRNQAWKEITDELNARCGRNLTIEQSMKKFLNIKTMVKYKLDEEAKKRLQPGNENYNIRLTPAEREYLRLFRGIERSSGSSNGQQIPSNYNSPTKKEEMDEEEEEEGDSGPDVPPPTVAMLMGEEDSFQVDDFSGVNSVTETLLGMIAEADGNNQKSACNSPSEFNVSVLPSSSSRFRQHPQPTFQTPVKIIGVTPNDNVDSNENSFLNGCIQKSLGILNGMESGRKRKVEENKGNEAKTSKNVQQMEDPEGQLKRMKCELIEMQKQDLVRREEWRLKKEFMIGRQTAALENIVLLLREMRSKQK